MDESKNQKTYVLTKRSMYRLLLSNGSVHVRGIRSINGSVTDQPSPIDGTKSNQQHSINQNIINQNQVASDNVNQSYTPNKIGVRARKSFAVPLINNVTAQVNAIQSVVEASQHQDKMEKIIQNATSDLKTTFENNMDTFLVDLEMIKKQYDNDLAELKTEFQSRLADLERDYVRNVEDAKKKVFNQ